MAHSSMGVFESKAAILERFQGQCLVCGRRSMLEFITETSGVFTHHYEHGDLDELERGNNEVLSCGFTLMSPSL